MATTYINPFNSGDIQRERAESLGPVNSSLVELVSYRRMVWDGQLNERACSEPSEGTMGEWENPTR
ncbi:MAG: hypothetical protein ACR2PG_20055 [Hyphomicrobiaceae bacterium]